MPADLPTTTRLLFGGLGELVTIKLARRLLAAHAGSVIIAAMQDLQQGATEQLGMMMGLSEPAWSYSGTEFGLPRMGHRELRQDR